MPLEFNQPFDAAQLIGNVAQGLGDTSIIIPCRGLGAVKVFRFFQTALVLAGLPASDNTQVRKDDSLLGFADDLHLRHLTP